ncbi:hypothetical protein EYC80_006072 [Monilinia laxa]|nr:hypothetical protein EYC80_006072 [Monilinia laxa]
MSNPLQRSLSRISNRRPSLLPRVDEYQATQTTQPSPPAQVQNIPRESAHTFPETTATASKDPRQPLTLETSIRAYSTTDPWAQFSAPLPAHTSTSTPLPPLPSSTSSASSSPGKDAPSYAGWMKKRRTKMLRHEWHEHHFTLRGTTLAMHKDARALDVLECIDVDDYAIACSSLASSSKLNAAFKRVNIAMGRGGSGDRDKKVDVFSFQLIPQAIEKGVKLKKRDSLMPGGMSGTAGHNNKTHYFAVKSRDERIDWMRELMLAKALKQKSEGYEVNVNGNTI